jgi:S-adenosylmethionine:diacylglycerol 3-amino-3-carboxypropyl transferase
MRTGRWSHGLVGRIDAVVAANLVREHPWWRPLTSGRAADPGHGAAWLDPDRLTTLVRNATGLAFVHDDLQRALDAEPAGSLSAISLSNVPDWLPPGAERSLAVAARRALAPGGRLLVRRVVRAAGTDLFAAAGLERDAASDALPARDRTALYEAVDLYRAP